MTVALQELGGALDAIAPLGHAESWDNVGLLVEPSQARKVANVLLTIDLTLDVLAEAKRLKVEAIVAYHPPIFSPLKRICGGTDAPWKQRIVAEALAGRIAIYSPHTALDAAPGGVCDWLCEGLGPGESEPISQTTHLPSSQQLRLVTFVPADHVDRVRHALDRAGAGRIGDYRQCTFNLEGTGTFLGGDTTNPVVGQRGQLEHVSEARLETWCSKTDLPAVARALIETHPYEEPAWEVHPLEPRPLPGVGAGRVHRLSRAVSLSTLVKRVKACCGLKQLRVAKPAEAAGGARKIDRVAVCPGAGGSLFEHVDAPAYLTGEMRHHDVLEKIQRGGAVILTDHTNTERGYLPIYAKRIRTELADIGEVTVHVCRVDRDPLAIV